MFKTIVSNAAKILDVTHPGWNDIIKIDELNMSHPVYCIAGQLNNSNLNRYEYLDEMNSDMGLCLSRKYMDFDLTVEERSYFWEQLRQAWIDEIHAREVSTLYAQNV